MRIDLHPAENRGYRELFLSTRQGIGRLERLASAFAGRPAGDALGGAATALDRMLEDIRPLIAAHDLHAGPAAEGSGRKLGGVRSLFFDRFLERNQALRLAVYDIEHPATLLGYLAELGTTRGDDGLADMCRNWERRLRRHQGAVRRAAVELGSDPDFAIEPLDTSPLGRAAHRAGWVAGSIGEWTDRQASRRRQR